MTIAQFQNELDQLVNKVVEEYGQVIIPSVAHLLSSKGAELYISLGEKIEVDDPKKLEKFIEDRDSIKTTNTKEN